MSETKWTKGPWLVATSCSWRRIVSERGDPVCIPTIQRSDNHPDLLFPNGGEDGPDARILAAAPELYAALDMLMDATGPGDAEQLLAEERKNIMALLAKARGES